MRLHRKPPRDGLPGIRHSPNSPPQSDIGAPRPDSSVDDWRVNGRRYILQMERFLDMRNELCLMKAIALCISERTTTFHLGHGLHGG